MVGFLTGTVSPRLTLSQRDLLRSKEDPSFVGVPRNVSNKLGLHLFLRKNAKTFLASLTNKPYPLARLWRLGKVAAISCRLGFGFCSCNTQILDDPRTIHTTMKHEKQMETTLTSHVHVPKKGVV